MKKTTYALVAANAISWGYLLWSGLDSLLSIQAQRVPGYPNSEQVQYLVMLPLLMVALTLSSPILLRARRWSSVRVTVLAIIFIMLFPFMFFFTGGM